MSPTRKRAASPGAGARSKLSTRSVAEAASLEELFEHSLPSFGGAYLRRLWLLLDEAIGSGVPMTLAVAGPVTASGQHHAWLNPLLDTGWFLLVSTTDAVCYHDGHRSLPGAGEESFFEVPIFGDDAALREEEIIRICDIGFSEGVLLDQDAFLTACLAREEFQRKMSGTEMRHLLGACFAAQEAQSGAREGFLALCTRKSIPVFVGAPADGSVFLNAMKLWALAESPASFAFELDLYREVFESCAIHWWGQMETESAGLGTLILGGGVPKNFNLQPEPALSQIFGLEGVRGYLFDIQITTAPVSDGSLSSCPPSEAVTWGKVDPEHFSSRCESVPGDYSMLMPLITKALLDKRARLADLEEEIGRAELFGRHPEARGYLRDTGGYRLYERLDKLTASLRSAIG
ncbi:MAG: deoxyhypusine synthase family protein [bacterium]|nr:hypothetical protein [Planctomycetota bacterium]HIL53043.1 hypothetical protein [Planctomycetota bacterium]